ncbi:MAG: hypothetical protein LBF22_04040 [Deltaproteobacteria bacterium]|jgi:hypothetical protein|nr:hypothetical protein [Deltaproteobacteria bacterium]
MNPVAQFKESFLDYQAAATVRAASAAYSESTPNTVDKIIQSGAPKPHATITNTMVAAIDKYSTPPGRNMRHYLALDVDRAGKSNTTVVDGLQRYLNIQPRREPTVDAKNIASSERFPTLVMDEAQAFAETMPYQFSVNGVVQQQTQPSFVTQGGNLRVRILGTGVSTIQTPETAGEPGIKVGPMAKGNYYPPAFAAQLAMTRLSDALNAPKMATFTVGPDVTRDYNETLSSVSTSLGNTSPTTLVNTSGTNIEKALRHAQAALSYSTNPILSLSAINNRGV